MSIYLSHLSGL